MADKTFSSCLGRGGVGVGVGEFCEGDKPAAFLTGWGLGEDFPQSKTVTGELDPAGGTACLASFRRAAAKLAWLLAFDCIVELGEGGPEDCWFCDDGWISGDDDTVKCMSETFTFS